MIVFGANLVIVCKDLELHVEKVRAYKFDNSRSVMLYDMKNPVSLLNMPQEYMKNLNAWITIPGRYMGWYKKTMQVEMRGKPITVPTNTGKCVKKSADIFEYVQKQYPKTARIYDAIYEMCILNGYDRLTEFLDKYATQW